MNYCYFLRFLMLSIIFQMNNYAMEDNNDFENHIGELKQKMFEKYQNLHGSPYRGCEVSASLYGEQKEAIMVAMDPNTGTWLEILDENGNELSEDQLEQKIKKISEKKKILEAQSVEAQNKRNVSSALLKIGVACTSIGGLIMFINPFSINHQLLIKNNFND